MDIFQINEYQLNLLRANTGGQNYVALVPDPEKDGDSHLHWKEHMQWNEQLVAEGFLQEVPVESDMFIQMMETRYGRKYRLFQETPLAIAMFSPVIVKGSEDDTYRDVSQTIH